MKRMKAILGVTFAVISLLLPFQALAWTSPGTGNTYTLAQIDTLTTDVTWDGANSRYVFSASVTISANDVLNVSAGQKCAFNATRNLTIRGTLNVNGASGNLATFTSTVGSPVNDSWGGIVLNLTSSNVNLNYARVEYGDVKVTSGSGTRILNLNITNSQFYRSDVRALYTTSVTFNSNSVTGDSYMTLDGSSLVSVANNTITTSMTNCLEDVGPYFGYALSGNSLTCNGNNRIELQNNVAAPCLDTTRTWSQRAYYLAQQNLCVSETGNLTINAAGSTFSFANGIGVNSSGSLTLDGTTALPIVLNSQSGSPTPGIWSGVFNQAGAGKTLVMDHVRDYYGPVQALGTDSLTPLQAANVSNSWLYRAAFTTTDLSDLIFDGNSVNAVSGLSNYPLVLNSTTVSSLQQNKITGNGNDYLIYPLKPADVYALDSNVFSGAVVADVYVFDGAAVPACVTSLKTWPQTAVYHVMTTVCISNGKVRITGAGSSFKFDPSASFSLNSGSLVVEGAPGANIQITNDLPDPSLGYFSGLIGNGGAGNSVELNYINWGYGDIYVWGNDNSTDRLGSMFLENSRVSYSYFSVADVGNFIMSGSTVAVRDGDQFASALELSGNASVSLFQNNVLSGHTANLINIWGYPAAGLGAMSGNTFRGGSYTNVFVTDSAAKCVTGAQTWAQSSARFKVGQNVCINAGGSVNVTGLGSIYSFNDARWSGASNYYGITGQGGFSVTGAVGNLTRFEPDSLFTYWNGIDLQGSRTSSLGLNYVKWQKGVIMTNPATRVVSANLRNSRISGIRLDLSHINTVVFDSNSVDSIAGSTAPITLSSSTVSSFSTNKITGATNNQYLVRDYPPQSLGHVNNNTLAGSFTQAPFYVYSGSGVCAQDSGTGTQNNTVFHIADNVCIGATGSINFTGASSQWRFFTGKGITNAGDVTITGAAGNQVRFTSAAGWPAAGDWTGITVSSGGRLTANYLTLEYTTTGVNATTPAAFTFQDSEITFFSGNGLDLTGLPAAAVVSGNYIYGTTDSVVRLDNGTGKFENNLIVAYTNNNVATSGAAQPDFGGGALSSAGGNDFAHLGAAGYAFYNGTANTIQARSNFWGTTVGSEIDALIYDVGDNPAFGQVVYTGYTSDTDGDGMPDDWEFTYSACVNPLVSDAAADPDGDGQNNLYEYQHGTDPCVATPMVDADGDGLSDSDETTVYFTNPNNPDTDGDGLGDYLEAITKPCLDPNLSDTDGDGLLDGRTAGEDKDKDGIVDAGETDPCNPDTDGDGLTDGQEVNTYHTNPLSTDTDGDGINDYLEAVTRPCLNELVADTDGDGLLDGRTTGEDKNNNGVVDPGETDPCNPDTDGDGLTDGQEVNTYLTNPLVVDTDGDGISDYVETITRPCLNEVAADTDGDGLLDGRTAGEDKDKDGVVDPGETDPCVADTDGDGLTDYVEVITRPCLNELSTDTDGDGLLDGRTTGEDKDKDGVLDPGETDPCVVDTDGDGLTDYVEVITRPCLNEVVADTDGDGLIDGTAAGEDKDNDGVVDPGETDPCNPDTDGDGLSDGDEVNTSLTNPLAADTDGDGLSDGYEVNLSLTNPLVVDTDGDGLSDGAEVITYGTNPKSTDTDADGMPDGWEVANGLNPLLNDAGGDADSDGLTNLYEYQHGLNPQNADTDGDGLSDGYEVNTSLTNPLVVDTDGDGLSDGYEVNIALTNPLVVDTDGDGLSDGYEVNLALTNPLAVDTDGDGMPDGWEVANSLNPLLNDAALDADSDGLSNLAEFQNQTNPRVADTDQDGLTDGAEVNLHHTNPLDPDTDHDGFTDGNEVNLFLTDPNSADPDSDSDGLPDVVETNTGIYVGPANAGTDPNIADTDGDGVNDGEEVINGSNPCDDLIVPGVKKLGLDHRVTGDPNNSNYPSMIWTGSEFGVSWVDLRNDLDGICDYYSGTLDCNYEIYFARISAGGVKIGSDLRVTSDAATSDISSLSWTGTEFGVSWHDNRPGNYEIYFARISAGGVKIGSDLRVTSNASGSYEPSLVWTGSEFGVSWHDFRDVNWEIYFARVSSAGAKIGSDLRVTSNAGNSQYPSLSWTGSEFGVSWTDGRDGNYEIYFTRVSSSGIKVSSDLRVTSAAGDSWSPSLSWTGSEFGVNWFDDRDGNWEIYFARVSSSGVKIGSDLRVTSDANDSYYPSLSWTGSEFGVGWFDNRDENWEIYFARVSAAGAKIGSDLRVTGNASTSEYPSLTWTGSEFGVSWDDDRDGNYEIYFALIGIDSDGDGLSFSEETLDGTNPDNWDTDGDGLSDGDEINLYYTNPLELDTDDDLMPDGWEVANSLNPLLNDAGGDADSDGLTNLQEYQNRTNPHLADTDGDGLSDGYEVNVSLTNPLVVDTDGDGLSDGYEVNISLTNPLVVDTDGDGMPDGWEVANSLNPLLNDAGGDADSDGLTNLQEYQNGANPHLADTDGDGLSDGDEVNTSLTNPNDPDSDHDGVNDGLEYNTYHTNPLDWDTDGDALPDAYEIAHLGSAPALDPLNLLDGAGNFDADGNSNAHEYWNESDPWTANPVGAAGCFFWADAGTGDGIISPTDAIELKKAISGGVGNYTGVIPNNGETHELDMDGYVSPLDLIILQKMIQGSAIGPLGSRPTALVTTYAPGATVFVGFTTHVIVSVRNEAAKGTPGFGVIFEIVPASSTATATLLGGDGAAGGSSRYDISGPITPGALSRIVLRLDSIGTLTLRARLPLCGSPGIGRSCPEIILEPAAVIKSR